MVSVRINGEDSTIRGDGLPKMADVIELVKTAIDPDHMITQDRVDGKELALDDWEKSTNKFETSIVEIQTGSPESFVRDRLDIAAEVVASIFKDFRAARKSFQIAKTKEANNRLVTAVNAMKAFFEWYSSLLDLMPPETRTGYMIDDQVEKIGEVCKRICQQQLYQSWWALGETLKNDLEPVLDGLEDRLRQLEAPKF